MAGGPATGGPAAFLAKGPGLRVHRMAGRRNAGPGDGSRQDLDTAGRPQRGHLHDRLHHRRHGRLGASGQAGSAHPGAGAYHLAAAPGSGYPAIGPAGPPLPADQPHRGQARPGPLPRVAARQRRAGRSRPAGPPGPGRSRWHVRQARADALHPPRHRHHPGSLRTHPAAGARLARRPGGGARAGRAGDQAAGCRGLRGLRPGSVGSHPRHVSAPVAAASCSWPSSRGGQGHADPYAASTSRLPRIPTSPDFTARFSA
jgi:hypothetical protein